MVDSPSVYFDSPDVYLSSLNLRKEISEKIQWLYKWNPSLTKITSPISIFTLSLSFVSHRANRLTSGGTPSGELTFGRKDRNLYIYTHAKGASEVSPPVILISSPVILCLRARGTAVATVVIRGFTENIMDNIERALDDGVNTFKALTRDDLIALYQELAPRKLNWLSRYPALERYVELQVFTKYVSVSLCF